MKPAKTLVIIAFLAAVIAVMGAPQAAVAAGTDAGVTVTNAVTVDYTVGGSGPFQLTVSVDFVVDNYVDLNADNLAAPASTGRPGDSDVFFTFSVSNVGNTTQDYGLIASTSTTLTFITAVESNGSPGYQAGGDTIQAYVDNLPADTTTTVYVVTDIPGGAVGGDLISFSLTAQTRDAAGAPGPITAEDLGADVPSVVQAVFADLSGPSDSDYDGMYSAIGVFEVVWTNLSVTKTSVVISDPIPGPNPPKAIPGAVVEYTVTVTNNGNLAANGVNVVDTLPGELVLTLPVTTTPAVPPADDISAGNIVDVTLTTLSGSGATFEVVYEATIQ